MPGIDSTYAAAALVQLEIAQFHRDRLRHEIVALENWKPRRLYGLQEDFPPVEVQAHLEGVLVALQAARDKLIEGIAVAHGYATDPTKRPHDYTNFSDEQKLAQDALAPPDVLRLLLEAKYPKLAVGYREWAKDGYVSGAGEMRRRAVHHVSTKKLSGDAWEYQTSSALKRDVDRRVVNFADALIARSEKLVQLIEGLMRPYGE